MSQNSLKSKSHEGMTHIDMSQSAKSYFRTRRYDPFPKNGPVHQTNRIQIAIAKSI